MKSTNPASSGHKASQSTHIQIRDTIDTVQGVRGRHNIRQWPESARKGLFAAGNIIILDLTGQKVLGSVPNLALVVVSEVFRGYLQENPAIDSFKVSKSGIEEEAIIVVLNWVNAITKSTSKLPSQPGFANKNEKKIGTFAISAPGFVKDLIQVRHAALSFGMAQYVSHCTPVYRTGIRLRLPLVHECLLLEACAEDTIDDIVLAYAERMGYLRRTNKLFQEQLSELTDALEPCPKVGDAVKNADARAMIRRYGPST